MTSLDDRYRSPASEDVSADTLRLSKDEWRYAAKVFGLAVLVQSLLSGVVLTLQTNYALQAFGAEARIGGMIAVSTTREVGPAATLGATSVAFVLVMRRRAKADVALPRQGLFWPIFLSVPLVGPLAGVLMTLISVLLLLLHFGRDFNEVWKSILTTFVPFDLLIGMGIGAATALIHASLAPEWGRRLVRLHDWPIFSCFVAVCVVGLTRQIVGGFLWQLFYYVEFGEWP